VIKNPARPHPPFIVINTGALRFDVLAGNFTANDQLITMPFANDFVYVPDVPRPIAEKLLDAINQGQCHKKNVIVFWDFFSRRLLS
jgi:hypothetical protein